MPGLIGLMQLPVLLTVPVLLRLTVLLALLLSVVLVVMLGAGADCSTATAAAYGAAADWSCWC